MDARHTLRMLGAVIRKNALEYVRYPVELFFSFGMPLIWFLPVYLLVRSFAPDGVSTGLGSWIGATDFYAFLVTGLVVGQVMMSIFWGIGMSLKRLMDIGLLETIWTTPISKIAYVLAESLFSLMRLVYEVLVTILLFRFIYGIRLPHALGTGVILLVPFLVIMYGFALGFGSLVLKVKNAETLTDTTSFLAMTLTGTQSPPQVFPRYLLAVSLAIPITHVLDLIRVQVMGIAPLVSVGVEVLVVTASALLFPVLGALAFRAVDRSSRRRGDIHVH